MLVATLGVGKRKAGNCQKKDCQMPDCQMGGKRKASGNCQKNVSVKSDLSFGQRDDLYTECLSVKSELDSSMAEREDPSEVTFRHCLDDQDDRYDGNQHMHKKLKLQKHEILKEPDDSEVKAKHNNEEIKVERESDESELENEEDREGEEEEVIGNNPTKGGLGSKKFSKKFKSGVGERQPVSINLIRILYVFVIPRITHQDISYMKPRSIL